MVRYGFPSRYKLKKTDEFSSVFSFRRRIFGDCLALHYQPNSLGYARLGIVASKKVARRAVARNYMRRVLREWFRLNHEKLGALDLVIRVQKPFAHAKYSLVQEELQRLLNRLQKQNAKSVNVSAGADRDGTTSDLAG